MPEKVQFPIKRPEQSLGFLFWQTTNMWQRHATAALAEVDLTHVQFVLLANIAWLERDGELVSQVELARQAKTDVMMTSKVVRTLERKGLIVRAAHRDDPRANALSLTQPGAAVLERAFTIMGQVDREFFAGGDEQLAASLARLLAAHQPGED
jgi:DNA-binding MarR family transcriptional regulator